MKVLVTGAGGFVGSHVARFVLRSGHSVCAVVRPGASLERLSEFVDELDVVRLDLQDSRQVWELLSSVRPHCAIHLAWYTGAGRAWGASENLECVSMTLSLARALAQSGCTRFVGVGTCAEYEWGCGVLSENTTPLKPRSLYGVCKNATREILEGFCGQTQMKFAWARLFYIYGPGEDEHRLVPSVTLSLLSGRRATVRYGELARDYLHVDDVASALWTIAQCELNGPVNVASGVPIKLGELARTIAYKLGATSKLAFDVPGTAVGEPLSFVGDIGRITGDFGWRPLISLEEGLIKTADWWRSRGCSA